MKDHVVDMKQNAFQHFNMIFKGIIFNYQVLLKYETSEPLSIIFGFGVGRTSKTSTYEQRKQTRTTEQAKTNLYMKIHCIKDL